MAKIDYPLYLKYITYQGKEKVIRRRKATNDIELESALKELREQGYTPEIDLEYTQT